jgi:uncharacterized membrane protein
MFKEINSFSFLLYIFSLIIGLIGLLVGMGKRRAMQLFFSGTVLGLIINVILYITVGKKYLDKIKDRENNLVKY